MVSFMIAPEEISQHFWTILRNLNISKAMVTNQNSIRKKLELLLNKLNKKKKYKIPPLIIRSAFGELRIEESRIDDETPTVSLQKFFKSKF